MKNSYIFKENYFILKIMDKEEEEFEVIIPNKYYYKIKNQNWYICNIKDRYFYVKNSKGVLLHEYIYNYDKNKKIKFLNGDTLDYRDNNILFINKTDICMHNYNKKNKSSKVGVYFLKNNSSWEAQITINKKRIRKLFTEKQYGQDAKKMAIKTRIIWEKAKILSMKNDIDFEEAIKLVEAS